MSEISIKNVELLFLQLFTFSAVNIIIMIATLPKTYYNKNHEKQHSKEKLMKKIKKLTSLLFCCLFLYLLAFPGQVQAASLTPTAQDNLSVKLRRSSDLISISNGYMRVFRKTNSVGIEYYDNSLQITDKKRNSHGASFMGWFLCRI